MINIGVDCLTESELRAPFPERAAQIA